MLNELNPNALHEPRRRAISVPEIVFAVGFVSAVVGLALISIPLALVAAGGLLMLATWRAA